MEGWPLSIHPGEWPRSRAKYENRGWGGEGGGGGGRGVVQDLVPHRLGLNKT